MTDRFIFALALVWPADSEHLTLEPYWLAEVFYGDENSKSLFG